MAISTAEVRLSAAPAWTLVVAGAKTQTLISGPAFGYEVLGATSAPASTAKGIPVSTPDGSFSAGALAAGDNIYARPIGSGAPAIVVMSS